MAFSRLLVIFPVLAIYQSLAINTRQLLISDPITVVQANSSLSLNNITVKNKNLSYSIDSEPPSAILKKRAPGQKKIRISIMGDSISTGLCQST